MGTREVERLHSRMWHTGSLTIIWSMSKIYKGVITWPCFLFSYAVMENSFYITLAYNASLSLFANNTSSSFTMSLEKKKKQNLELDGSWIVRISEIIYPHTWYNTVPSQVYFKVRTLPAYNSWAGIILTLIRFWQSWTIISDRWTLILL